MNAASLLVSVEYERVQERLRQAAGEFQWEAHAYTTTGRVGGNVDYEQRRTYTNGSGGSITIEEIGMYVDTFDSGEASQHFCILRDLTGGVAVADTYTASVKYTLRTTV